MGKLDKLIMVIGRDVLFRSNAYFEGFRPHNEIDFEQRILESSINMLRARAEEDANFKQPIAYCMVVNPSLKKVFAYQRSKKDEQYGEKRLQGKWSWGVGGHIEKADIKQGNPIRDSMLRELEEEIEVQGSLTPKVLGYINDDSDSVGQVHFGIFYAVETNSEIIMPKDPEIALGALRSISELEEICANHEVEGWSRIVLEPLKEYLNDGL